MEADRRRLLATVRRVAATGPARVILAEGTAVPGPGLRVTHEPAWRLVLATARHARYAVQVDGRSTEVVLAAGELLVAAPEAWIVVRPQPAESYRSLGIVVHAGHLRVYTVACRPGTTRERLTVASTVLPPAHADLRRLLDGLRRWRNPDAQRHTAALALHLVAERLAAQTEPAAPATVAAAIAAFVSTACDRPLGRDEVARLVGVHPNSVPRLLRAAGLGSFRELLDRARCARARDLLADPHFDLTAVATACGFADASAFIRAFRRAMGVTPAVWRLSARKSGSRGR